MYASIRLALAAVLSFSCASALAQSEVPLTLTPDQLARPATALAVPLPGATLSFATRVDEVGADLLRIRGRSPGGDRLTLFLWKSQVHAGDVYTGRGHYQLARADGGWVWRTASENVNQVMDVTRSPAKASPSGPAPRAEANADGHYEIDVLVVYTAMYASQFPAAGAVRAEAERMIAVANGYFENSLVPIRHRLAGLEQFDGTSEDVDLFANQEAMRKSASLRAMRDAAGADLVILLVAWDGTSLCGVGGLFNNGERTDPPEAVDPERDALQVVGAGLDVTGDRCNDSVFAHELGHALGGGHAWAEVPGFSYWKPYAHATACAGLNAQAVYTSVMFGLRLNITREVPNVPNTTLAGDFFSNPNLLLEGEVCGLEVPGGVEPVQADNARSMTEAAPYVAAYRPARPDGKASGTAGGVFAPVLLLAFVAARRKRAL